MPGSHLSFTAREFQIDFGKFDTNKYELGIVTSPQRKTLFKEIDEMRSVFIAIFLLAFGSSLSVANEKERDKYDKEVDRVAFSTQIAGTTWLYFWRGREFTFSFEPNGSISNLQSWSNVKWKVEQKDEVILIAQNQKMYLHFDNQVKRFTTVDWDGKKASGKLALKVNEQ